MISTNIELVEKYYQGLDKKITPLKNLEID
jgi:hypothetical protein